MTYVWDMRWRRCLESLDMFFADGHVHWQNDFSALIRNTSQDQVLIKHAAVLKPRVLW